MVLRPIPWLRSVAVLLGVGVLLVAACGDGQSRGDTADDLEQSETVQLGARLYQQHCADCHGSNGERLPIAPLKSKAFLDSRGDATLLAVVAEGKSTMPAFGTDRGGPLGEGGVRAVVAYLNAEAGRASTTLLAGRGAQLYQSLCVSCHGDNGDRIPVVPLDADGFLNSRTDAQLVEVILNGKNASPAFGEAGKARRAINAQDATALVSFLRYRVQSATVKSVGTGRDLYVGNCLSCHGTSGDRIPDVNLSAASYLLGLGDGRIITAMSEGTKTGPAFGRQSGGGFEVTDMAALLRYLKSWAGLNVTAALSLPGGGGAGEALYMSTCATCHGPAGDQVSGVQLRSSVFLSSRGKPVVRQTIVVGNDKGMPAWGQEAGGSLTSEQIDSLLDFLFGASAVTPGASGTTGPAEEPIFDGKTASEFFASNCAACHGAERQGIIGPALLPERLTESDDFYFETIKNGRPGTPMPSWGAQGVTDEQIRALIDFITSEPGAGGGGSAAVPAGGGGDAIFDGKTASEFFASNCAACHGAERQGVIGPALLPERLTESDDFYFETIKNGRPGTPMPSWGAQGVTDEQIRALIDFITSEPGGATSATAPPPVQDFGLAAAFLPPNYPDLKGQEIFQNICSKCHGADGLAVAECPIGSRVWIQNMSDEGLLRRISRGKPSAGMPTWGQQDGGPLTDTQIRAVAQYLASEVAR